MNKIEHNQIINFIQRRFSKDCDWISGNCYYFAIILKTRFPQAIIWYDVIYGHFFANIEGRDYDWTGEIHRQEDWFCVEWEKMNEYDENEKSRILRDCIL